jgi:hypothetical protein
VSRRAPAAEVSFPGSVEGAPVAAPVASSDSEKPVAASVHQLVAVAAEAASLPAAVGEEVAWLPEVEVAVVVAVVLKDAVRAQQPAAAARP